MPNAAIPKGMNAAVPMLAVRGAAEAIEFYKKAFGAQEVMRLTDPGGKIVHAEIRINDAVVMLAEESPQFNKAPQTLGGTSVIIHLYVDEVDTFFATASGAGGKALIPIADQFYGDRCGRLQDPFGHVWIISTHLKEMTVGEMQRCFDEMMRKG